MGRYKLIFSALILLLPSLSTANPYYGATASYVAAAKDPTYLHGNQFTLLYDPQRFQWRQFNIYFDGSFSHFWITNQSRYRSLNIYSLSPVIRYIFKKRGIISPFIEFGIGPSYLTRTRLDDRNFGMHYAFQDKMGIGFFVGTKQQFSLGIHAAHYSNAHFAKVNSGITIPLIIDFGYRFSRLKHGNLTCSICYHSIKVCAIYYK